MAVGRVWGVPGAIDSQRRCGYFFAFFPTGLAGGACGGGGVPRMLSRSDGGDMPAASRPPQATGPFWSQAGDEALKCLGTLWRNDRWDRLFRRSSFNAGRT